MVTIGKYTHKIGLQNISSLASIWLSGLLRPILPSLRGGCRLASIPDLECEHWPRQDEVRFYGLDVKTNGT